MTAALLPALLGGGAASLRADLFGDRLDLDPAKKLFRDKKYEEAFAALKPYADADSDPGLKGGEPGLFTAVPHTPDGAHPVPGRGMEKPLASQPASGSHPLSPAADGLYGKYSP